MTAAANCRRSAVIGCHDRLRGAVFDSATGRLDVDPDGPAIRDPVALLALRSGGRLYAIHIPGGGDRDAVRAYRIDKGGRLTFVDAAEDVGRGPCHLDFTADRGGLLVSSYESGDVALVALGSDGSLGAISRRLDLNTLAGGSDRRARAHCCLPDPTGQFLLVADLGRDTLWAVPFSGIGEFDAGRACRIVLPAGEGPRSLAFARSGRWLYLGCELGNAVRVFAWDATSGGLVPGGRYATLPRSFGGRSAAAEMQLRPDGRFLYISNRGHNSIATFAVDEVSGDLEPIAMTPTMGRTPRSFDIDATGRWLMVANSDSQSVAVFAIDGTSGRLVETGPAHPVRNPRSCRFLS